MTANLRTSRGLKATQDVTCEALFNTKLTREGCRGSRLTSGQGSF